MTPFRQVVRPGDKGADVLAYKRALKRMGAQDAGTLILDRYARDAFVHVIRSLQHNRGLPVDGIVGRSTHALIAPHFSKADVLLYRSAAIRPAAYVNPFSRAQVVPGRTDMGVDYHGTGPIVAIGDAVVIGLGGSGWPGGQFILYKLLNGPHAGRYVYVAEAVRPAVHTGQKLSAGDVVCWFGPGAAPGLFPGIETGWGSPTLNLTYAATTTGYREGVPTAAGKAFARLLRQLGANTQDDPGAGPTFPL